MITELITWHVRTVARNSLVGTQETSSITAGYVSY